MKRHVPHVILIDLVQHVSGKCNGCGVVKSVSVLFIHIYSLLEYSASVT
jgi:hypothetical protein